MVMIWLLGINSLTRKGEIIVSFYSNTSIKYKIKSKGEGYRVKDAGCRVKGQGSRVKGQGSRVKGQG